MLYLRQVKLGHGDMCDADRDCRQDGNQDGQDQRGPLQIDWQPSTGRLKIKDLWNEDERTKRQMVI